VAIPLLWQLAFTTAYCGGATQRKTMKKINNTLNG